MINRHTTKLFTVILCFLLAAVLFVPVSQAAAVHPSARGGGAATTGVPRVSPHPSVPAYHGPSATPTKLPAGTVRAASPTVKPSPVAGGMVELTPGKTIDIPEGQVQSIQGVSGESISGKRPDAQYYRATGPMSVSQGIAGGVSASTRPGPSISPEMRKRVTCIVLDEDEWYMETGTHSVYGGTLCYRH